MAIDTEDKRRNATAISLRILLALTPVDGVDDDDRENASGAYIGFDYEAAEAAIAASWSKLSIGVGTGI